MRHARPVRLRPAEQRERSRAVVGDHDHDGVSVVGPEQHHDVERGRVALKGLLDPIWIAPRDGYLVAKMGRNASPSWDLLFVVGPEPSAKRG